MLEHLRAVGLTFAGTVSTAVAAYVAVWLVNAGLDIDQAAIEGVLYAVLSALWLALLKGLNELLPRLVKTLRLGASLPQYSHE